MIRQRVQQLNRQNRVRSLRVRARQQDRSHPVLEEGSEHVFESVQQTRSEYIARGTVHGSAEGLLLHEKKTGGGELRVRVQSYVPGEQTLCVHTVHPQSERRRGHVVLRSRTPDVKASRTSWICIMHGSIPIKNGDDKSHNGT